MQTTVRQFMREHDSKRDGCLRGSLDDVDAGVCMTSAAERSHRATGQCHLCGGKDVDGNASFSKELDFGRIGLAKSSDALLYLRRVRLVRSPFVRYRQRRACFLMPASLLLSEGLVEQHLRDKERWQQEERSRDARRPLSYGQGGLGSVSVGFDQLTMWQSVQTCRPSRCDG